MADHWDRFEHIKVVPPSDEPGLVKVWEVVMYQTPRHFQCFAMKFRTEREAMGFAELELHNPIWSQVVVHPVYVLRQERAFIPHERWKL